MYIRQPIYFIWNNLLNLFVLFCSASCCLITSALLIVYCVCNSNFRSRTKYIKTIKQRRSNKWQKDGTWCWPSVCLSVCQCWVFRISAVAPSSPALRSTWWINSPCRWPSSPTSSPSPWPMASTPAWCTDAPTLSPPTPPLTTAPPRGPEGRCWKSPNWSGHRRSAHLLRAAGTAVKYPNSWTGCQ